MIDPHRFQPVVAGTTATQHVEPVADNPGVACGDHPA